MRVKKKKGSVLGNQRPLRERPWKNIFLTFALCFLAIVLIFLGFNKIKIAELVTTEVINDIRFVNLPPEFEAKSHEIANTARLEWSRSKNLSKLAEIIQRLYSLQSVSLVRTDVRTLTIQVVPRKPQFLVGHHLAVGTDGEVFQWTFPEGSTPKILGVLQRKLDWNESGEAKISDQEKGLLKDGQRLYQVLSTAKIICPEITYVPFRGFQCKLFNGDGPTVFFGQAPFDETVARLQKVIAQIEKKASQRDRSQ